MECTNVRSVYYPDTEFPTARLQIFLEGGDQLKDAISYRRDIFDQQNHRIFRETVLGKQVDFLRVRVGPAKKEHV